MLFCRLNEKLPKRISRIKICYCVSNPEAPSIFQFILGLFLGGTLNFWSSWILSKRSQSWKFSTQVSDFSLSPPSIPQNQGPSWAWIRFRWEGRRFTLIKQYPWEKTINMYKGISLQYKYQARALLVLRAFLMYICREWDLKRPLETVIE